MSYLKFVIGLICALVIGFLYAGISGAIVMGLILSLTISYINKHFSFKKFLLRTAVLSSLAYFSMFMFGLLHASESVHLKVEAIKKELLNQGFQPKWIIISQKRNNLYNNLLYNSVKNGRSKHLTGRAIDLYVFDINGDWLYNAADFELLQKASRKVDSESPHINGRVYNYLNKGTFSRRMVHVEVN